jgi:hypothetical protein
MVHGPPFRDTRLLISFIMHPASSRECFVLNIVAEYVTVECTAPRGGGFRLALSFLLMMSKHSLHDSLEGHNSVSNSLDMYVRVAYQKYE